MEITSFISNWNSQKDNLIESYVEQLDSEKAVKATQDSLIKGLRPDGVEMKDYTPFTVRMKRLTGGYISPSGKIALKDKGDFFNSMYLRKEKKFASLDAEDVKTTMLKGRFGNEILDTPEKDKQPIIDDARDRFINYLKSSLGL